MRPYEVRRSDGTIALSVEPVPGVCTHGRQFAVGPGFRDKLPCAVRGCQEGTEHEIVYIKFEDVSVRLGRIADRDGVTEWEPRS